MKNIFKSLMLVAVAAMGFTACEKENNENNNGTEQTRVVNFTATIGEDDTRSGFSGTTTNEEGKTLYTSTWDGGEWLIVKLDQAAKTLNPTIEKDGTFSVELSETPEFVTVYSPILSWKSSQGFYEPDASSFAEQTPREDSVDPNAHLLKSDAVFVDGEDNVTINMHHALAYGKMTVDVEDFDIASVSVKLVGNTGVYTYTLNAANVKNNVFWFGVMPIDVTSFTVTVYNTDRAFMTKEVTIGDQPLKFQAGRVSTFSVEELSAQEQPTTGIEFTSAEWTNTYAPGDKFVEFKSAVGTLQLNFWNCNSSSYIDIGSYTFDTEGGPGYIYPGWNWMDGREYSVFRPVAGDTWAIESGNVNVSIEEGEYYFEFINLSNNDGTKTLNGTFKGTITNLKLPQ